MEKILQRDPDVLHSLVSRLVQNFAASERELASLLEMRGSFAGQPYLCESDIRGNEKRIQALSTRVPTISSSHELFLALDGLVEAEGGLLAAELEALGFRIDRLSILWHALHREEPKEIHTALARKFGALKKDCAADLIAQLGTIQESDQPGKFKELPGLFAAAAQLESIGLGTSVVLRQAYKMMDKFSQACTRVKAFFLTRGVSYTSILLCHNPEALEAEPVQLVLSHIRETVRDHLETYRQCLEAAQGSQNPSVRLHLLAQVFRVPPSFYDEYHYLECLIGPPANYPPLPAFDASLLSCGPVHARKRSE